MVYQEHLHPYCKDLAASVTLIIFAVQQALTTRKPLPQFFPSARLAHLRLINKVRQVIRLHHEELIEAGDKQQARANLIAWNASAAAQVEIIEYVEELTDLTKMLVKRSAFCSGHLTQPTYRDYVQQSGIEARCTKHDGASDACEGQDQLSNGREGLRRMSVRSLKSIRQRKASVVESEEIPVSLQRIRSRMTTEGEHPHTSPSFSP